MWMRENDQVRALRASDGPQVPNSGHRGLIRSRHPREREVSQSSPHSRSAQMEKNLYKPSTMNERDFVAFMRIAVASFTLSE